MSVKSLLRWTRNAIIWLAEPRLFWLMLSVLAAGLGAIAGLGWSEQAFRITGMTLEIFGLGTVALGISKTRKQFGRPSTISLSRQWISRFPTWPRNQVIALAGIASAGAVGSAHVLVADVSANHTIEGRVDALEKKLEALDRRLTRARSEVDAQIRENTQSINEERGARTTGDDLLRKVIEEAEVGGLNLSAIGLVWLLAGLVLSTIPAELVRLMR